ncbi:MAG: hypothetical protein ACE5H0_09135 [Bacteroidota bacterium]
MAVSHDGLDVSLEAAADLSSLQYCFVKLDTSGKAAAPGANDRDTIGVLQNDDADAAGKAAVVRVNGTTKLIANEAINEGSFLTPVVTTGKAENVDAANEAATAKAISAATAQNDVISALIIPGGLPHATGTA